MSTQHSVPRIYHPVERTLERATRPLDTATVFVSRSVQRAFGVAEEQDGALTIYNGIDTEGFNQSVTAAASDGAREDLIGHSHGPVYLNVGHCRKMKRQVDLVRAMDAVVETQPDARLVIVGDGEMRSTLSDEVRRRGLGDHVTLTGRVPKAEVHRYYAAADVFAFPSLYEGMPMTLLEAMAAELPVVGTRAPGIAEFVRDGETGTVVPRKSPAELADAMLALRDDGVRDRLGANAYDLVRDRYDIQRTTTEYLDLYESVSNTPRP